MTKLDKAIYYANRQIENRSVYVWSGQGEKLSKFKAVQLAKMETSADNAARVIKFIFNHLKEFNSKTKVFDCSGFICCMLIYAKVLSKGTDASAAQLYTMFERVAIGNRQAGDLVYKSENGNIVHVGFVLDPNTIIECKGRDYGIVKTKFDSTWKLCNRPTY